MNMGLRLAASTIMGRLGGKTVCIAGFQCHAIQNENQNLSID